MIDKYNDDLLDEVSAEKNEYNDQIEEEDFYH